MKGRRQLRIGLVLISVAVVVVVLIWWQDRPLRKAEELLQAGNPAESLEQLDEYLARRPEHQRALLLKARALVALQQWPQAIRLFAQTGAGTNDELRAWATALLHQQQWREALPLLERLAANGSNDADMLRDLTVCRYQLGQADAALASATELASLPGHRIDGLFQRGLIHESLGNTHLAIENWEQIEALTPDGTGLTITPREFFRVYAEDLMSEGRPRQASAYFQRSLDAQPSAEVLTRLGDAWYHAGQEDEAARVWREVLKHDGSNDGARMGLAEIALSHGDAEAALQLLVRSSPQQQTTLAIAYLTQRAYTLLGNEELAEEWQQRVATLRKAQKLQAAFEARSDEDAG